MTIPINKRNRFWIEVNSEAKTVNKDTECRTWKNWIWVCKRFVTNNNSNRHFDSTRIAFRIFVDCFCFLIYFNSKSIILVTMRVVTDVILCDASIQRFLLNNSKTVSCIHNFEKISWTRETIASYLLFTKWKSTLAKRYEAISFLIVDILCWMFLNSMELHTVLASSRGFFQFVSYRRNQYTFQIEYSKGKNKGVEQKYFKVQFYPALIWLLLPSRNYWNEFSIVFSLNSMFRF